MARPCILGNEVAFDSWSLASVASPAAVIEGLSAAPGSPALTRQEAVLQTMRTGIHCVEFGQGLDPPGQGGTVSVERHGDLLFGVQLRPAIDTDDLVLRIGGGAPMHLRVKAGVARLSGPLLLVLLKYHPVTLDMPGLETFALTAQYGTVSGGLLAILEGMTGIQVEVNMAAENGTVVYGQNMGMWLPAGN